MLTIQRAISNLSKRVESSPALWTLSPVTVLSIWAQINPASSLKCINAWKRVESFCFRMSRVIQRPSKVVRFHLRFERDSSRVSFKDDDITGSLEDDGKFLLQSVEALLMALRWVLCQQSGSSFFDRRFGGKLDSSFHERGIHSEKLLLQNNLNFFFFSLPSARL